MEFPPVLKKRLSEVVVDNIKRLIEGTNLVGGDQLPSEQELAKLFKVGKASVREALRMLEITGVIEVKPGKGVYVKEAIGDIVVPLTRWVSNNKDVILKHFEARLIIEPEIASLAAQRITVQDIRKIKENIRTQNAIPEEDVVSIIERDIEFHILVAKSAKNETLEMLFKSLAEISFHGWKAALRVKHRNQSAVREHKILLQMLIKRDESGARKAMKDHMLVSVRQLKDQCPDFVEP